MMNEIPQQDRPLPQARMPSSQQTASVQEAAKVGRSGPVVETGTPGAAQPPQPVPAMERSQVEDVAQGLQKLMQAVHRQLNFKVDEDTGKTVIQVIDSATDEVVRQIPPDGILELQRRLTEIQDTVTADAKKTIDGMLLNTHA